ncbi:bacillithiol biosynthesis cysteine-adding enzyme BshC [Nonlabens antarcticus]|uniref:bacillithiol biosynthesis cysteine-adding enzyme BshC n=1 Tax=Nonlabens antarcticus TaxID=392714 RepID=UPI001891327D|nr:bacillithiol biosynthesis cysteine-adding enzyme BshC [Nonlabens antarcticus]
MSTSKIPYQRLRYFSNLIKDYLDQKDSVSSLYHRFPNLENFKDQINEKSKQHNLSTQRQVLKNALVDQYKTIKDADATLENISLLEDEKTFTITTGHQLNLFTGPLYFLYKIISTINLCKTLSEEYPENNFVPVYWMATEDHDFDEIKYFNFGERKLVYDRQSSGAVGRLETNGLDQVREQLQLLLGSSRHAADLIQLFTDSYKENNLANATRFLAHELFKNDGLVIIDADDVKLKQLAIPFFKTELQHQESYKQVSKTLENWNANYKVQVNPREINLFYLTDNDRYRIIKKDGQFFLDGNDQVFSQKEILQELKMHPERFSPNVIMRPLYQEIILPNLCYIGGGGEIAYWLELKDYFESQEIPFPVLLLRNSALLIDSKQLGKLKKLDLIPEDLFQKSFELEVQIVNKVSEIEIDFASQKEFLKKQFEELYTVAQQTDPSFKGAVGAQERKQIKGLEHLEKRLLKAQKHKWSDHTSRALKIQHELFPSDSLQERQANFSYYYKDYGPELLDILKDSLNPLEFDFTVIEL